MPTPCACSRSAIRAHSRFGEAASAGEGMSVSADQAAKVRRQFALSFGSCSFREPVDELRTLATA